jgi:hypothetical protein
MMAGAAGVAHGVDSHHGVLSLSRTRPPIAVTAVFVASIDRIHLPNKTDWNSFADSTNVAKPPMSRAG